jgi:hypothetical protein
MAIISRRTAISRILGAAVIAPLGLRTLTAPIEAAAQEAGQPQEAPGILPESPGGPLSPEPGYFFWTLADAADAPVKPGRTKNDYGREIGYQAFEDGVFIHHHHYNGGLRGEDWMSSRIGEFSILDGALMIEGRGLLNEIGCFALEMRHQAYKDRRYIRSNWLAIDPPTSMMMLQTDGIWTDMVPINAAAVPELMQPLWEWNRFLFLAQGFHFEGWLNGQKVVEGENDRFGRGRISLVTMRMNKAAFRTEFRNLHVWDGIVPDPMAVWG